MVAAACGGVAGDGLLRGRKKKKGKEREKKEKRKRKIFSKLLIDKSFSTIFVVSYSKILYKHPKNSSSNTSLLIRESV